MLKYLYHSLIRASLFFLFLIVQGRSYAQEKIKSYVQQNTVPVHTIEPDSVDYTDLEALGNAVGDAKVVMLGEQDHGDAATFLAKGRIIKYLHEKKGFNVLAFESDFFGLNYNWDHAEKSREMIDSVIRQHISFLWGYCHTCQGLLYDYIPSTFQKGKPLEITGFDIHMYPKLVALLLDSQLRNLKLPITLTPQYATEIRPSLGTWAAHLMDTTVNNKYLGYLAEIKEELGKKLPRDDFWLLLIDNLVAQDQELVEYTKARRDHWKLFNVRDRQMALNLKWLNEIKYPGEKIIVWAHNYHISKSPGYYPQDWMTGAEPMATLFTGEAGVMENTYILGFTSYEGTTGRLYGIPYELAVPGKNSFENWIPGGYDYAFLDFKKFNTTAPDWKENFILAGGTLNNRYHTGYPARWNKIFDGVFFIRKMYPCEKADLPGGPALLLP